MPLLVLFTHCADEVNQTFALEPSILNLLFGLYLNVVALILEDLTSDNIPSPEEIASLRPELIAFLGDELPEALITDTLLSSFLEFLEVVSLVGEGGSNQALVLGMLEVDNIMRLYLVLLLGVLKPAMQDKLPKTLALVLVYYVDSSVYWLFDRWPILRVFVSWIALIELSDLVWPIKDDGDVSVWEIHVAVRLGVMQPQTIIIVDLVSQLFIRTMRNDPKVQETRQLLNQFQLECALADISCLEDTAEILSRLDMLKNHLRAIGDIYLVRMLRVVVLIEQRIF